MGWGRKECNGGELHDVVRFGVMGVSEEEWHQVACLGLGWGEVHVGVGVWQGCCGGVWCGWEGRGGEGTERD